MTCTGSVALEQGDGMRLLMLVVGTSGDFGKVT